MTAIPTVSLGAPISPAPCRLMSLGGYSIRIADQTDPPCAICSDPTGSGPVGYFKEAPVCDRCLDEGCRDLGMILALITAARIHDSLVRQCPTALPAVSPAALYLANMSEGSQGMRQPLDVIAGILDSGHDADSYPWHELTYRDTMAVRQALIERYAPSTVNKMLSALRGVLKQTWRLGLIEADS